MMHLHLASSCSSSGFPSLSGVLTLSVLTMHVGRWRLSMRMSCCRSSFSSSICAFRSEFSISSLSDSCEKEEVQYARWKSHCLEFFFPAGDGMSHLLQIICPLLLLVSTSSGGHFVLLPSSFPPFFFLISLHSHTYKRNLKWKKI